MKKKTFTKRQRQSVVEEHEKGKSIEELCREYQISPATFYNWKKAVSIAANEEKRRLKQLEEENARLKKMYSELSMDHEILKEGYQMLKKWQAQDTRKK